MSFSQSYNASHVIVLGDGGSSYRERIYPEYKGNRKKLRAKQTAEEAEDFQDFLKEFDKACEIVAIESIFIRFKGVEADDIAAYIATNYSVNFEHTWLISTDADWHLLVSDKVSQFSYRSRTEVTLQNWHTHHDYTPEEHISIKVLQGDKGDNVPGVAGIGEKRAYAILREYGSALDVYDALPLPGSYVYIKNLNEFGDKLLLNYELMDLVTFCSEALGRDNCEKVDSIMEELIQ